MHRKAVPLWMDSRRASAAARPRRMCVDACTPDAVGG